MKNVVIIYLSLMLIVVNGCTISSNPETVLTTENDDEISPAPMVDLSGNEKDYLKIGFDLMRLEKTGGLYCSMEETDVILLLGEHSTKETPRIWDADGLYHWDCIYPEIGLTINYASKTSNSGEISSYYIQSNAFNGSTARGITIGSKKQDILDAYKNEIDFDEMSLYAEEDSCIIVGTIYGRIIFNFSDNDEVVSIFVGAAAE